MGVPDRLQMYAANYLRLARNVEQRDLKALLLGMAQCCNTLAEQLGQIASAGRDRK
jgi:hypothetical protein